MGGILALGLSPAEAAAQCGSTYTGAIRWGIDNSTENMVNACGSGPTTDVWVRVLSGSSGWAQKLYFLGVDDGVTNWAATTGPGALSPIEEVKPAGCVGLVCIWDGTPYTPTYLGSFTVGATLVFGLQTGSSGSTWLVSGYSGAPGRAAHRGRLYDFGKQGPGTNVYADDRRTQLPPALGVDGWVYGWDDGGRGPCGPFPGPLSSCGVTGTATTGADLDYQDLVFELRTEVVPEPASLALLATGLVGLSGVAAARRRRQND